MSIEFVSARPIKRTCPLSVQLSSTLNAPMATRIPYPVIATETSTDDASHTTDYLYDDPPSRPASPFEHEVVVAMEVFDEIKNM